MARDAIARQYDVEKNSIALVAAAPKGQYVPGMITFHAKKGRSIDLVKLRESIAATRLSGGTNMRVDWLEITIRGEVTTVGSELRLKVAGTGQEFVLGEDPGAKAAWQRLREARERSAKITSVSARVPGWTGRFPDVLKALATDTAAGRTQTLLVTDFEVARK